ncbi:MAG: TIGR02253 family HAD-type hydrolase [Candidatus Woesearchaeota archaeon]
MIKAVLFDLDNTLIDFMKMKKRATDAALDAMIAAGVNLDKEKAHAILNELYDHYGIEHQNVFDKFLIKTQQKVNYKILAAGIVAYRKEKLVHAEAYPGVVQTLLKLKQKGLKLAIVSDAPILQAWTRLTEMRIQDFFDAVVTFDDTGERKPSATPFKKALEKLDVKPEEVLHVGDWPERDIAGAKALGIKTAFAKYGAVKPTAVKADYELNKIEDLLSIINV